MADDRHFPEEEYQFSDIENAEPFATERKVEPPRRSQSEVRSRVLIAIAIIVTVLVLYNLYAYFFTGKEIPKVTTPPPAVTVLPTPKLQPQQAVTPQPSIPQNVVNALSQVQEQANEQGNSIKSMQAQVTELQTTLHQLNTNLTAINSRLDAMQKEMQELKPKPIPVVLKPAKVRHRVTHRKFVRTETYYIKAIVPGRAWLKIKNGATITVSSGSFVQGYGRIMNIDPQRGRILTSSGRVIRYSPEDR